MRRLAKNNIEIFEDKRMYQNRKILRYRACLAQLAVVCVGLKHLNGELLSLDFCRFFKESVKRFNAIRASIQAEIQKQSAEGSIEKETRVQNSFSTSSRFMVHQRLAPARSRFLVAVHSFCDMLLSELHVLNYEHLSDHLYEVLGELMDLYSDFRRQIAKERELQSQCKPGNILEKAS